MSKNPLSDFIRRLGRQKRDAIGEPAGPPGFPIEMHPADQNSELQAAIIELLRAQNRTSPRDKKAIGVPSEIIHFQDAFGHHGTLTKHHEFHHIPHPAVPSLGGHALGHDHGHSQGHGHEHSHGHQIAHPHQHLLSHPHPQPQPHPHIESLQKPLTAAQLEDALTEILLELNHGGSSHNLVAPHPVPAHTVPAHHQTPLIQPEMVHQLGGLLQTGPLPIQPHHDSNLIETELVRQLEGLLHTGPLPHPPEPISGHLDSLHTTPDDPNISHDPFHPVEDPLHHHPDPLHPHVEPHLEGPPLPYDGVHPPIITTEELPAPYGCRAIATKTCNKVPYVVADKVPYETCELVPSVKCHLELKKVAELVCTPVIDEECNDFAKEVPYLVEEEQCEEVTFDDCVEVGNH